MSDHNPAARMAELIFGYMATQAISVAAKLGIADLVADAPRTAEELADKTGAHALSLVRLMQMLSSIGVFEEDAAGRFRNTALGETLRSDHPSSFRGTAIMNGTLLFWKPWADLHETIMSGQTAFDRVFGATFFDYLTAHADDAAIFNAGMTASSSQASSAFLTAYDFSRFERIVDIGGGHGLLLNAILLANPQSRGVLFDQPPVVAAATIVRSGPVAQRCEIIGGDFFRTVPEGGDLYVMKQIIHDWNDEDALKILKSCRRAMTRKGKLLLLEQVLKPVNEPDLGKFFDVHMMVLVNGRERTESDFRALLRGADLSLTRIIPTPVPWQIIECEPT